MDKELGEKGLIENPLEQNALEEQAKAVRQHSIYSQLTIPQLDKILAPLKEIHDKISSISKSLALPVFPVLPMLPAFQVPSVLTETWELMRQANEIRAEKYPAISSNLTEAASHSWFASVLMDFHSYEELAFITDGVPSGERQTVIESAYADKYRELFAYLSTKVTSMFPTRSFAIIPACAAHERGEYALSVPVFFSQAEGILRDITSSELFSEKISPITKFAKLQREQIPTDEHWINMSDDAIWAQLSGNLPIGWGPKLRADNEYVGLNRNTTLHGIDLDYANEINSLKAFSLLCHISGIAEWLTDEEQIT